MSRATRFASSSQASRATTRATRPASSASRADVGAGSEGALGAAEHDAADRGVVVEHAERVHELLHQLVGERVQLVGTVEEHDRGRLVALDEDEAHPASLRSTNARTALCAS